MKQIFQIMPLDANNAFKKDWQRVNREINNQCASK